MAKSVSPAKARVGRPKTKSEPQASKARSKSRTRVKKESRGRSPTPKATKAANRKRSASKPRARSRSRKAEPKPRSVSRKSTSRKSLPAEPVDVAPKVQRRSTRETKANAIITASPEKYKQLSPPLPTSNLKLALGKIINSICDFGYRRTLSALWWLCVLPLFVLGAHVLCVRDKCYLRFDATIPKTLRVYLDRNVIYLGAAVFLLQIVCSALPIGRIVSGFGYRRNVYQYRSNSFLCLTISVVLFLVAALHFRLPNIYILQQNRFKCVCAGTAIAFLYSILLYLKALRFPSSYHVNHGSRCGPGITHNHVHDFVHGREVSPKIGRTFDLGLVGIRFANTIWVLLVLSTALPARGDGPVFGLSWTVAMVAGFQLLYVLLGSFNEIHLLKSAFIHQGVGFLSVYTEQVLSPFLGTLPLRFLVESKRTPACLWCYPLYGLLFLVGIVLIHYSNTLKYKNALQGGKTLRNGPWKLVRHPNYLGELLCILAWTLPCGMNAVPYAHFIFVASLVVCRSRLVEKNVNSDYRAYQNQVKSRVVPFVY